MFPKMSRVYRGVNRLSLAIVLVFYSIDLNTIAQSEQEAYLRIRFWQYVQMFPLQGGKVQPRFF